MSDSRPGINRRDFLKTATATAAIAWGGRAFAAQADAEPGKLPKRQFGKHPEFLSIVGFGGVSIKGIKEQARADRAVAKAYEMGVNYYDVAPAYGNAQELMGPALAPYRKNCFLACKTNKRDAENARADLKRSLELLKTDHFDLYQFHHVRKVKEEVDVIFGKGGAMELVQEAKKDGRIKYVGFSAHSVEAALELINRYDFDSIMFPINFGSFFKGNFGPQVLKLADSKGLAKLAIKPMCRQDWPKGSDSSAGGRWTKMWYQPITDPREAELALKWAYSLGITAALPPGEEELEFLAIETAMKIKAPITEPEIDELKKLALQLNPTFREGKLVLAPWMQETNLA